MEKLKEELPAKERDIWPFLASIMGKRELEAFNMITTGQWKEWLPLFEKGLLDKARNQSLDSESLHQCLIAVSNRVATLPHAPVAAYSTKQGDVPVWIIVLMWEHDVRGTSTSMGHVQVFAFDSRNRKLLGSARCN